MGCWNETCMLTHLPIEEGEDTVCVFIAQQSGDKDTVHSDAIYAPISLPLFGEYDDYGRLENFADDYGTFLMALGQAELALLDENSGNGKIFNPMEPIKGCSNCELTDFLDLVGHGSVYIRDEEAACGYSRVYLAFIKKRFFENAVKAREKYFIDDFVKDISFRIRLSLPLKRAIREGLVGSSNLRELAAVNNFMDVSRISWHPTCGSGSQNCLDHDYQMEFYKEMFEEAARLYRQYR